MNRKKFSRETNFANLVNFSQVKFTRKTYYLPVREIKFSRKQQQQFPALITPQRINKRLNEHI